MKYSSRMSLRARLTFLCVGFLALVIAASSIGAHLVIEAHDARRLRAQLGTASTVAMELETTYVNKAASVRAYFLSADPKSLEEYVNGRAHAQDVIGRLQGLLLETDLQPRLDKVAEAGRAWRVEALNPLIELQEQGQADAVISGYRDGPSVLLFQRTADALQELRDNVDSELAAANRKERASRGNVARFIAGAALATLLALLLVRVLSRIWIARPVRQLASAVRSEDAGGAPIRSTGAAELDELATEVENLRGRLREELDLATRTREGLSQNAAVLMSLRTQLETSPDDLPTGWSVSAQLVPAMGIVAGDCYDIDYLPNGGMAILVVDVAGHGASSAVVALRAKELLRAGIRTQPDPSAAIAWASEQLSDLESDMFVTAFAAVVDFSTGLVRFVNAGHPPALLCDGVNCLELGPTGPLLGPFDGQWRTREAIIGPGQMLVCYTDGLVEVRDERREEFGMTRLQTVLCDSFGDDTEGIVKETLAEVESFGAGRAHDDVTLTVVARAPSQP